MHSGSDIIQRIAVLAANGVQTTRRDKIDFYYLVDHDYDFSGNSAVDVTTLSDLSLFNDINSFECFEDYRNSLNDFYTSIFP